HHEAQRGDDEDGPGARERGRDPITAARRRPGGRARGARPGPHRRPEGGTSQRATHARRDERAGQGSPAPREALRAFPTPPVPAATRIDRDPGHRRSPVTRMIYSPTQMLELPARRAIAAILPR